MELSLTEKLRFAMIKQNMSQTRLAELTDQTQKNLSNKMIRDNYKLSEYQRLVEALGCTLEINIVLPNGEKL
ncbi:helix-turn-helix domain-containing protein [Pumilibacter intestinalis]|uniref:helix-turn-helix domain-containing protein n=1 Tax=Pumilibacter intestinalis TaxID=2941511 RepID=UPI00203ABB38|nr:helix-turn-helix domain-containing protein [Pumilibacter intestinalis]